MKLRRLTYLAAASLMFSCLVITVILRANASAATVLPTPADNGSYGKKSPQKDLWNQKKEDLTKPLSQVIVQFNTASDASQEAVADKYNAETKLEITPKTVVLDLPESANPEAIANKLENESSVVSAEPDYKNVALAQSTSWGYDTVNAADALADNSADGDGVTVAVVDSGVDYYHNELSEKVAINDEETPGNGIDDDGNGFIDDVRGWDFSGAIAGVSPNDNDPMDELGHGTHVSGIIAADNDSDGVVGVAPEAKILPVRVLDDQGYGTNSNIAAGIRYATDNGADIINMSLGGPMPSSAVKSALDYAEDHGVLVVAAAGNEFSWNVYSSYPAAYSNVISVGATGQDGKLATFSNYGKVDIAAPGVSILSTIPDNRYARYSGTSMASPFVAANLALIKQKHSGFDASQLRHELIATSHDLFTPGIDQRYGGGLIDADTATSSLSNSIGLQSSTWRIVADDGGAEESIATISARLLDSSGDPVEGESIDFATDHGDLSAESDTTDADGIASVTLTADNIQGMANITATHEEFGSQSIQVLLLNNNVEAHEVRLYKEDLDTTTAKFLAGENVTADIELRNRQLAYVDTVGSLHADIDYQVIDESDDSEVSGLSGTLTNKTVEPNTSFVDVSLNLPIDLVDGIYRFEAVVTDRDSEKTSQISYRFQVGGSNDVLIVPLTDSSIDQYNLDYATASYYPLQPLLSSLDSLGEDYDVWPGSIYDFEDADQATNAFKNYPVVLFVGASSSTDWLTEGYVAAGGNAYISGNTDITQMLDFEYNPTGWCANSNYSDTALGFSCEHTKAEPTTVSGLEDTPFDGQELDISAYNFNSNGSLDNMFADELNPGEDGVSVLEFTDGGVNDPAVAGYSRDDGLSHLVLTGFGVSAIDNQADKRDEFVSTVLDYLRSGDSLAVDDLSASTAYVGEAKPITITGEGFSPTGQTTVTVDDQAVTNVSVTDRNTMSITLPTNLTAGIHDVTVTDPFGQTDTLTDALTLSYRTPQLTSVVPGFVANNAVRTITLNGKYFRSGAKVKLGTTRLGNVHVVTSKVITANVPKDFATGTYDVSITNTDNKKASKVKAQVVRYGFRTHLKLGMTSNEVEKLEKRLIKEGYLSAGSANTYYGTATRDAVRKMQQRNGLAVTGELNKATRKKINTTWDLH